MGKEKSRMNFLRPCCAALALERAVKVFPAVSSFQPYAVPHFVRGSVFDGPWVCDSVTREGLILSTRWHSMPLFYLGWALGVYPQK